MLICILPRISWLSGALNFIGLRFCNRCARQPAARSQVLSDQPPTPPVNFSDNFPSWEWFNSETERLQFLRCRNLSLIVPLYGPGEITPENQIHPRRSHLCTNAASNETYSAKGAIPDLDRGWRCNCPDKSIGRSRPEIGRASCRERV